MADVETYAPSDDGPLRQGEVISGLVQMQLKIEGVDRYPDSSAEHQVLRRDHPIAVVITQDCDLDWDFKDRRAESITKLIPNVLFCEVVSAEELRGRSDIKSDIWKRIRMNRDERYQFLEKVPAEKDAVGEGLPEMAMDFKCCFSIPTDEVYLQLRSEAKRRCCLTAPYREHLSHRVFSFHSRIALPAEHHSEPSAK